MSNFFNVTDLNLIGYVIVGMVEILIAKIILSYHILNVPIFLLIIYKTSDQKINLLAFPLYQIRNTT